MSKPRTSRPRTADCAEVMMLLRGQGLDCDDASVSDHDPEPEERPEHEGQMLVVAAYCGPCVASTAHDVNHARRGPTCRDRAPGGHKVHRGALA